ncbi:MAG: hypothetical protein M1822_008081 [Bathelium mastoideum]|nr:MAG: hypothetical protein M1822_008081 [Bathelium mastoideum]
MTTLIQDEQKFSIFTCRSCCSPHYTDILQALPSYGWWIRDHVQKPPGELFSALSDEDSSFCNLWQAVLRYILKDHQLSIDDITSRLFEDGIFQEDIDQEPRFAPQSLVFALIGWQTMLYQHDMGSCSPAELAIVNEMGSHQGHSRICMKQDISACKKPLHDFLLGFGILLPPRGFNSVECGDEITSLVGMKSVSSASFNAQLLTTIGDIRIEWVDSLSCHLEFDEHNRKLFLFRHPAFCAHHISKSQCSAIHACAAPLDGTKQWAGASDVSQLLREIILSYRLLFGQNKKARRLFRRLNPFQDYPKETRDEMLYLLCGRKRLQTSLEVHERESYDLTYDFPILGPKLATLVNHLSERKPRTWRELWQDKRDSASWLTLWAVLIFGVLGIILALLQVIFQIIQVLQH